MKVKGTVTKRCGCRNAKTGKQLVTRCSKLKQRTHGTWECVQELPLREDGTRRRFRRSGYSTKSEAQNDLGKVRNLLIITEPDDTEGRRRLGDLLESVSASKGAIPEYEATRRRFATGQSLTQHTTVGEWLETWLAGKKGLRKSGQTRYDVDIRCHLVPRIGHIRLDRLTVPHLDVMFEDIAETNIEITDTNQLRRSVLDELKLTPWKGADNRARRKALKESIADKPFRRVTGPSSQQHIRATLRAALNAAIARGMITFNAASYVELASAKRPKALVWEERYVEEWLRTGERPSPVMVWTPEQAGAFLDFLADRKERLYALFHLITFRGLRRGEACGERWIDRDRPRRTLTIATQLVQDGWNGVVESAPKTDSGERVITLDRYTDEVLEEHRTKQDAERADWGEGWKNSGRMFTQENGEPLHPGWLTDHFARLVDESGLPPIRLHDLRHVAASLMLAAEVDVKIVSETLGHSDTRITRDTYQSVMPQVAAEAAEATAAIVPRGTSRSPETASREAEQQPSESGIRPDGHTGATHEGAKIIAFRPRRISA